MWLNNRYDPLNVDLKTRLDLYRKFFPENKYKFDSLSASLFKPSDTSTPNFGFTNSGVWVKLALTNETNIPQNLVLEFSEPQVDYFQVYFPESEGTLKIYKAGDFEKFSIREIRYHNFLFPFSIKENSSKEIYLHFEPGKNIFGSWNG